MIKINRPECPNKTALKSNYKHQANKEALKKASFGKCMYCESKISHTQYGDVEHIKPKSKFPSLEFKWNNLGYVCAKCNNFKKDKFDKNAPFINPYDEDPSCHFIGLGAFIQHKKGSERGEITIAEIELNRLDLLERRQEKIKKVGDAIDRCYRTSNEKLKNNALEELKKEGEEDKEYSLFIKNLLKSHEII